MLKFEETKYLIDFREDKNLERNNSYNIVSKISSLPK